MLNIHIRLPERLSLRSERGFTITELVVASSLLVIIATSLTGFLTASIAVHKASRARTLGEQTVLNQIEKIRGLAYTDVGQPSGNPAGTVAPSTAVAIAGLNATMTTTITYVNDPIKNAGGTIVSYVTNADYKKVVVTLTSDTGKQLAQDTTYVAPPGKGPYTPENKASMTSRVQDFASGAFVGGASVTLSGGVELTRGGTTDGSGTILFPSLTPTSGAQYYDLTVALTGYQVFPDDLTPNTNSHMQLAPGQAGSSTIRIFKPASINLIVNNSNGTPYIGTATVALGSSRKVANFTVTNGTLSGITAINGESVIPGPSLTYTAGAVTTVGAKYSPSVAKAVPNAYPTDLTSTFTLTLNANAQTTKTLTLTVKSSGGTAQNNARVDVTGGPLGVYMTGTTNSSGVVVFTVPSGTATNYTAKAYSGALSGTWTGAVNASNVGINPLTVN